MIDYCDKLIVNRKITFGNLIYEFVSPEIIPPPPSLRFDRNLYSSVASANCLIITRLRPTVV